MKLPKLTEAAVAGKRVLVRVDFNVSLKDDLCAVADLPAGSQSQIISNDTRIREAIPTISYLLKKKATPILVSHLGRPKSQKDRVYSLACVGKRLEQLIGRPVIFIEKYWTKEAIGNIRKLPTGSLVLCENLRFYPGEEQNDVWFSRQLASLAQVYVNDAFGTAHRTHASTVGVTAHLPSYAGFLLSREVDMIGTAMTQPKRPFLVVIGGGKTPEKIRVIEKLLDIADTVYLGGAVANTFFATWGISVGVSRVDHEMIEMARAVLWKATRTPSRLMLPNDVVVSDSHRATAPFVLAFDKVPGALGIFDIGPQAREELAGIAKGAKTIIWNGPMGMYEDERFMAGTDATFRAIADSTATTIIGGGDTISTIRDENLLKHVTHVSTGGSAMLEFMEKGTLPAIEALRNGKT